MALLDGTLKQLEECNNLAESFVVITGIEKLKRKYLKEKNNHFRQIFREQEMEMDENNEMLKMMYNCDNKMIDVEDDMSSPYGQEFQSDLFQILWNQKTASDDEFLKNRERNNEILKDQVKTLPKAKQLEEVKHQMRQHQVKLNELGKKLEKKNETLKKLQVKLVNRQNLSDMFINTRKQMLADLEESNRQLEEMENRQQSEISSNLNESKNVQEQQVEPIPVVEVVPVEPINVPNNEPKVLQKIEVSQFNMNDLVLPIRRKKTMYYKPMDPLRTLPEEDFQRQQSKRKSTDGFMDGSKSTKQPKTHHSDEMSGDNDDRRKSSVDGNKENFIQHDERQRKSRAAGPSSAQEDGYDLMVPIQRSPYENVGNVYENCSAPKNHKQRDALQFSSVADTLSRSYVVQPVPQRSSAFVAYGSQQKLPSSYSSSLSPEDRSKVPQQTGRVSDHRQEPKYGDGRKSSSHRNDDATVHYDLAGRGKHGETSAASRSTVPQKTGRKSDPSKRQNQYAIENDGRYQSTPGDGRKSTSSRNQELTKPYPGQKTEMRESISPAKQRSGHGIAAAIKYDDRKKQRLEAHRETTQASFNRDEKMDGQREPNKPKEHGLAPNAPSKHQTERESSGDEMQAISSAPLNRRNNNLEDNYGTENRQSGRESDSSLGRVSEQRKFKANPVDDDDMQRCHGNTTKASGSAGPIQPEFLVPTTKPSDMKPKMDNKRLEQSKSDARVSPALSVVSSARSQFSYNASEQTDLDNLNFDDFDFDDLDADLDNKSTSPYTLSERFSVRSQSHSNNGDKSVDEFNDWGFMGKHGSKQSPLSDSADFESGEQDEVPEGFENH